jgi:hypothetical protein
MVSESRLTRFDSRQSLGNSSADVKRQKRLTLRKHVGVIDGQYQVHQIMGVGHALCMGRRGAEKGSDKRRLASDVQALEHPAHVRADRIRADTKHLRGAAQVHSAGYGLRHAKLSRAEAIDLPSALDRGGQQLIIGEKNDSHHVCDRNPGNRKRRRVFALKDEGDRWTSRLAPDQIIRLGQGMPEFLGIRSGPGA